MMFNLPTRLASRPTPRRQEFPVRRMCARRKLDFAVPTMSIRHGVIAPLVTRLPCCNFIFRKLFFQFLALLGGELAWKLSETRAATGGDGGRSYEVSIRGAGSGGRISPRQAERSQPAGSYQGVAARAAGTRGLSAAGRLGGACSLREWPIGDPQSGGLHRPR